MNSKNIGNIVPLRGQNDYSASTQLVYLNAVLEGSRLSNIYKDMSGSIFIRAIHNGTKHYFTGYIDQLSLITRAKSATEILENATLVCYFSFDSNSYADSGPWNLNRSCVSATIAVGNGRINDGISFASALSYFVVGRLTKLGIQGQPHSIAVWIQPTSINDGTMAHVTRCAYNCALHWCLAFIGLTSGGEITIQSWTTANNTNIVSLTGPVLSINVWTHVVQTYSSSNGMCLYVNGVLFDQSTTFIDAVGNLPGYIYLSSFPWSAYVGSNVIALGQYYALLDEFRLFFREITAAEVYALVHLFFWERIKLT